ncbi:UNVERIFIED_CONTAM: Phenylalanine N-monooxygenase [Sesamum radiatum]|uniref:Phenylalanine N-monooxygenase n=1 Tax=Sesamum radiatum TaxID=300843 RepID=A0AAW2QI07_SESRA
MLAAIDNLINGVEWALAEMINQSDIFDKACKKLDQVVGRNRLVDESVLHKLNYVKPCIKDAFKLHPVAPFNVPRVSTEDTIVGGYFIPKGVFRPHSIHTRARIQRAKQGKITNSLYAVLQDQEYSKAFKAKIESFVKDTIKLALTNFGTPSGTALPFISSLRQEFSSIQMDTQGKAVKLVNSKLTISKFSSSSTRSIGVTTRSMSKKLKDSSRMTPLTEYVQKDLDSPNHTSEDEENKSPPSSPRSADNVDACHIMEKQVEAHNEAEVSTKQRYTENDKSAKELQVSSDGLIPVDQLKEFIEGTIRSKIEGSLKSSLT